MLQKIRDLTHGWFTWILISFICFTFALWGINNYMGGAGQSTVVARVNNVDITDVDVQTAFQNLLNQQRLMLGASFMPDEQFEKNLHTQALEQLIVMQALVQAVKQQGFNIANEQVQKILLSMPIFQVNKVFSPERFIAATRMMHVSQSEFLNQLNQQLLVDQVQTGVTSSAFILPSELLSLEMLKNQKRDIRYFILPLKQFVEKQVVSLPAEKDYYQSHEDDFKLPIAVKIDYVKISRKQIQADPRLNGDEQKVEGQFAELSEKLANSAYENPDELKPVADELGLKIISTDYFTKEKGIDIAKEPAVLKVVFGEDVLNQGYNSEVISLENGDRVVLRINSKKPAQTQAFEQVKAEIEKKLKQKQGIASLQKTSASILEQIKAGTPLATIAKTFNVSVQEKNSLSRQPDASNPLDPILIEKAFSLKHLAGSPISSLDSTFLKNGDYAIVELIKIKNEEPTAKSLEEKTALKEQFANTFGKIDYDFYMRSVVENARIKRLR